MTQSLAQLKQDIINNLEDSKARDIVTIDLDSDDSACDVMIITSGTSDRHAKSIADKLIYFVKHHQDANITYFSEGLDEGKWILIDMISIVVHIFQPEVREFYRLEELWQKPIDK